MLQTKLIKRLSIFFLAFLFAVATDAWAQPSVSGVTPSNTADCVDLETDFVWETADGDAVSFVFQLSESSSFTNLIYDETVSSKTFTAILPNYQTQYYWRVEATFDGGATASTGILRFWTKMAPPLNQVPANGNECANIETTFDWSDVDETINYVLQISYSSSFTSLYAEVDDLTSSSYTMLLPEYNTEYFWRVKSEMGATCETEFSDPFSLTTAMRPPTMIQPVNGAFGLDKTVEMTWSADDGYDSFNLMVDDNSDFSSPVFNETDLTDPSYTITLPQNNTQYFWKVQADYDGCLTDWTAARTFTTKYDAVLLDSPEDNVLCVELVTTYSWEAVNGATMYRLQISDNPDYDSPVVDTNEIANVFFQATIPDPITVYYWRVRAEDDNNVGYWSTSRTFTSTITAPELLFPDESLSGLPLKFTLVWQEDVPNSIYNVQVSRSTNFLNPIIKAENLDEPNYDIELDDYFEDYYWRVQAVYNTCSSSWSEVKQFRTVVGPPGLIAPADSEVNVALKPRFEWEHSSGATQYEISVATDTLFDNVVLGRRGILSTNFQVSDVLEKNTLYYWRIRASNNEGTSLWSDRSSFTTGGLGAEVPILLYPEQLAEMIPVDMTFDWDDAERADRYQLQVALTKEFFGYEINIDTISSSSFTHTGFDNYTEYFWRVLAINDSGKSSWSEIRKFRTIALPVEEHPVLRTPENNLENLPVDLTFSWHSSEHAEGYSYQLAKSNSFTADQMVVDEPVVWGLQHKIYDLEEDMRYFWRVRGWNEASEGPWSEIFTFTTTDGSGILDEIEMPFLSSVSPHPVTDNAMLFFTLPTDSRVVIKIYNSLGQEVMQVADQFMLAGEKRMKIVPVGMESGIYIYTIEAGNRKETRRMIYLR